MPPLLLLLLMLLLAGCSGEYRIIAPELPYCPVSDSAWAKADSVPAICLLPKGDG